MGAGPHPTWMMSLHECQTCNNLFSRKTQNAAVDTHPSNFEIAAQQKNPYFPRPAVLPHVQAPRGGGWLLSGIICINILILGSALVSSNALTSEVTAALHRQIFLIVLLVLTMLWMIFYTVVTSRKDQAVLCKDSHAGPLWLRVGLLLFGLLSLIMDIFKIANYMGYLHCKSAVEVSFPFVQVVFLFVQTYFLWIHSKDCVQLHTDFTRCGLTLMLSTNLVMWMAAVIDESVHQLGIANLDVNVSNAIYRVSYGDECSCNCSHPFCDIFEKALYYLYPFNLEYCLFASAMAYIMWKNVGRIVDGQSCHSLKFHLKNVCLGPLTGILLVVAGLVTFIVYKMDIQKENEERRNEALLIHFIVNIVILSLMSGFTVVGCVMYRLDRREHVSEKNPSRSLDVGLLVIASMGQFIISYFTIVAVMATGASGNLDALNLIWALLTVLELGLQNCFIIKGLHRKPYVTTQDAAQHRNTCNFPEETEMSILMKSNEPSSLSSRHDKLSWKRRVLKDVCMFLLCANVILWIMPAFGARPQFQHLLQIKFYKFTMWAAVVNVGLPFGIFYRMHSVASLIEVYLVS
ncbi:hypothetical protein Q5P01_017292 [Channa striata]|uniref:Otopetrin 2 n=1 Tax=Channa striata TaxID=64152 RepID=A0AA88M9R9_CHASR|nr:hypothetical protein Q5P01_017292 [Channa striata]